MRINQRADVINKYQRYQTIAGQSTRHHQIKTRTNGMSSISKQFINKFIHTEIAPIKRIKNLVAPIKTSLYSSHIRIVNHRLHKIFEIENVL